MIRLANIWCSDVLLQRFKFGTVRHNHLIFHRSPYRILADSFIFSWINYDIEAKVIVYIGLYLYIQLNNLRPSGRLCIIYYISVNMWECWLLQIKYFSNLFILNFLKSFTGGNHLEIGLVGYPYYNIIFYKFM